VVVSLGTNLNALTTQRLLGKATQQYSSAIQRLSSGLRINQPSDDPAGLAVSSSLKLDSKTFTQAIRNVNDAISLTNINQGALEELSSITARQKELAEQSANGVLTTAQRVALNVEANALVDEFNRIVAATTFNGRETLSASNNYLQVQAGYGSDGSVNLQTNTELDRLIGTGAFSLQSSTNTGDMLTGAQIGDINGDGYNDVALKNSTDTRVLIYFGDASGSFATSRSLVFSTGSSDAILSLNDLNNDGRSDIILASAFNNNKQIYISNSDGSFLAVRTVTGGGDGTKYSDFNGDGNIDLLSPNDFGSGFGVHLGNGDGYFKQVVYYSTGVTGSTATAADVNNDGYPDIIGLVGGSVPIVYMANSNGTFAVGKSYTSSGTSTLTLSDFNQDGYIDIATNANNLSIQFGNGDGSFRAAVSYSASYHGSSGQSYLVDQNGDGYMDFVTTNGSNTSRVSYGNSDGSFAAAVTNSIHANAASISAMGDLNNDGVPDILSINTATFYITTSNTTATTTEQHVNITTAAGAREALGVFEITQRRVLLELGNIGSSQSRLSSALATITASRDHFDVARGRIEDADIADESANMIKYQVLQNAGAALLAHSKLDSKTVLKLLNINT
jgi:flagellin